MTYIGIALHSFQSLFIYVYYPIWSMHRVRQPLGWVLPVLPIPTAEMRNWVWKCPAHRRPAGRGNAGAARTLLCYEFSTSG